MIRVAVSGAAGQMGRLAAEAALSADDLELAALYDPGHVGEPMTSLRIVDEPELVGAADVVVEFTRPEVVMANLEQWQRLGVHAVVGTSGFTEERVAHVRQLFGEGPPNCIIAPNFSIGAVLMMRFSELAAAHLSTAEVTELHHHDKPDSPSGTAIATAERIAAARKPVEPMPDNEIVPGARGASVAGVPVHSVRMPGIIAQQSVLFGGDAETLEIRHNSADRRSFMPGVLLAVRSVDTTPGVTLGIEYLLGIG